MSLDLDPRFADGLRDALVQEVRRSDRPRRRRRWVRIAVPVVALGLAGGSVAIAVQGPWASIPGGDIVTPTSEYRTTDGVGEQTVELGDPPPGSTAVEVRLTCRSEGRVRFPADRGFMTCGAGDPIGSTAWDNLPIPSSRSFLIKAHDGVRWTAETRYLNVEPTAWGVNARGETYGGFHRERGMPDLLAVGYVTDDGRVGYARESELSGPLPTSPADALRIMREREKNPPVHNLYDTDGVTVIGCLPSGGSPHPPPCG